jgi:hypothetical protein
MAQMRDVIYLRHQGRESRAKFMTVGDPQMLYHRIVRRRARERNVATRSALLCDYRLCSRSLNASFFHLQGLNKAMYESANHRHDQRHVFHIKHLSNQSAYASVNIYMLLKTTDIYPLVKAELRTSEEIARSMSKGPDTRPNSRPPLYTNQSSAMPQSAAKRGAEVRRLLAELKGIGSSGSSADQEPRKEKCPSSSLSVVSSLGSPTRHPPGYPPIPRGNLPQKKQTRLPSPRISPYVSSAKHAPQRESHRRSRSSTPMDESFVQDITWPPFPEWPSELSTADEMRFIEGEIELYRIREAYERSVGRKIVASYRKRLLKHERDVLIRRVNGERQRMKGGRRVKREG